VKDKREEEGAQPVGKGESKSQAMYI